MRWCAYFEWHCGTPAGRQGLTRTGDLGSVAYEVLSLVQGAHGRAHTAIATGENITWGNMHTATILPETADSGTVGMPARPADRS